MKTVKAVKARAVRRGGGKPSVAAKRHERDMIMVSRQEYEGLKETIDLLSRPANARRLRSALAQAKAGKLKERDL